MRFDDDLVGMPFNGEFGQRLHRRVGLAYGRAETGEIVAAYQRLPSLVHSAPIELNRDMPDVAPFDRRRRTPVEDAIPVVPADSREAGVEVLTDCRRLKDCYRIGLQVKVERIAHRCGVGFTGKIKMGDLAESMDAAVGSPSAMDGHRLLRESVDGLFQRLLDRPAIVLALPTDKTAAVILDVQPPARHDKTVPRGNA